MSHAFGLAAIIVTLSLASCAPAEPPPPEDTRPDGDVPWGYSSEDGPAFWASLSRAYDTCGSGTRQSPIDLSGAQEQALVPPAFDYGDTSIELRNTGHTIEVAYDAGSWLGLDGERYALEQVQFHTPSEHTVDGRSFPLEIHLMHRAGSGSLAFVAIPVESGSRNETLQPILDNLPVGTELPRAVLDARFAADDLLPETAVWLRYEGSLTTPPCSEGVAWIVLQTPIQVDEEQIGQLRSVLQDNNRPVQPTNGRPIVTESSS